MLKIVDYKKVSTSSSRTKMGGQPDWIDTPQWPLSSETGNPMRFIAQIDLSESVYKEYPQTGKMAYIFMTEEDGDWIDGTYEMDGGENAVIIQSNCAETTVDLKNISKGPTHSEIVFYPVTEPCQLADDHSLDYLGGKPLFIQGDEYPDDSNNYFFLAQLSQLPFEVNFGDTGTCYIFVHKKMSKGLFFFQCH